MAEKYSIGAVKGFQVVSEDGSYYSKVFPTIEEAQAQEKALLKTPEKEKVVVQKTKVKDGGK